MLIDGKAVSEELKIALQEKVGALSVPPSLVVFSFDNALSTRKFVDLKKAFAASIGIDVHEVRCESVSLTTEQLLEVIKDSISKYTGIIVQLPLPPHIDVHEVRNAIPQSHDVDLISDGAFSAFEKGLTTALPPVVGAFREILVRHNITLEGKKVVVVGEGRLVGGPAAIWARLQGGIVEVVNDTTSDIREFTKEADILILGAGAPGLITPDMIKEGVVILDAGTSEASGKLRGDADPQCADRAALFTPVPGGIGPITVAMIFENLLILSTETNS